MQSLLVLSLYWMCAYAAGTFRQVTQQRYVLPVTQAFFQQQQQQQMQAALLLQQQQQSAFLSQQQQQQHCEAAPQQQQHHHQQQDLSHDASLMQRLLGDTLLQQAACVQQSQGPLQEQQTQQQRQSAAAMLHMQQQQAYMQQQAFFSTQPSVPRDSTQLQSDAYEAPVRTGSAVAASSSSIPPDSGAVLAERATASAVASGAGAGLPATAPNTSAAAGGGTSPAGTLVMDAVLMQASQGVAEGTLSGANAGSLPLGSHLYTGQPCNKRECQLSKFGKFSAKGLVQLCSYSSMATVSSTSVTAATCFAVAGTAEPLLWFMATCYVLLLHCLLL